MTNVFSWKLRRSVRINGQIKLYLLLRIAEKFIGAEVDNCTFKARKLMKIVSISRYSRFYARKLRKVVSMNGRFSLKLKDIVSVITNSRIYARRSR